MRALLIFAVLGVLATGCKGPSMNTQRSALRGTGDVVATVLLERVDAAEVPAKQALALKVIAEVEKALDAEGVPELTLEKLQALMDKVPGEYRPVADAIMKVVRGVKLPTDKLGSNNIKRIRAALKGLTSGINGYRIEDRRQE